MAHTHLSLYALFPLKGMRTLQRASDRDMPQYVSMNFLNYVMDRLLLMCTYVNMIKDEHV